jgi:hypothetical protein
VKRNWVMKLLVVCNAAATAGFLYSAYHIQTFSFGFPNSWASQWFGRFAEIFPGPGIFPGIFFELTGRPLVSIATGSRTPAVILDCVLAFFAGVLTYGLARYGKWARTIFGLLAMATGVVRFFAVAPIAAYAFSGNFQSYISAKLSEPMGPEYPTLGLVVSLGCAWLMWKWRKESDAENLSPGALTAQTEGVSLSNAWEEARRRKLKKWLWGIRASIPLIAIPIVMRFINMQRIAAREPLASRNYSVEAATLTATAIWILLTILIWYLVWRPERRLGVGMALAYGALQSLSYIGLALSPAPLGVLYLMGVWSWQDLVIFFLPLLAAFTMLVCAIGASIQLGRPSTRMAGKWGTGVLAVLLAGVVLLQIMKESTYAKSPEVTRVQAADRSEEYRRGHTARGIVRTIGKCVFQYAAAHPQEGFPGTLDQVGPTGDGCVRQEGELQVPGRVFVYEASSSSGNGARDRFKARSKEVEKIPGTFGLPDEMVDETGIFADVAGRDKRGFAFSPGLNLISTIGDCLKRDFEASGGKSYPQNLRGILSIKGSYGTACVQPFQAKELSVFGLWRNKFTYSSYGFTYAATQKTGGQYKGFLLQARPQEYGREALRSYYMDEKGIVCATPEDRAANSADPDAACELAQKDCSAEGPENRHE